MSHAESLTCEGPIQGVVPGNLIGRVCVLMGVKAIKHFEARILSV